MGQIDIALNWYFGNEECADFINAMYYDGREVVGPDDFIEQDPVMSYIYKDNNITKGYKRERDFFRMVRASDAYYVFIGFEYLQRKDLNIDQPTADVINALVLKKLEIGEKL